MIRIIYAVINIDVSNTFPFQHPAGTGPELITVLREGTYPYPLVDFYERPVPPPVVSLIKLTRLFWGRISTGIADTDKPNTILFRHSVESVNGALGPRRECENHSSRISNHSCLEQTLRCASTKFYRILFPGTFNDI